MKHRRLFCQSERIVACNNLGYDQRPVVNRVSDFFNCFCHRSRMCWRLSGGQGLLHFCFTLLSIVKLLCIMLSDICVDVLWCLSAIQYETIRV